MLIRKQKSTEDRIQIFALTYSIKQQNIPIALQTVTFHKHYDWTTLQVKFRGTLRSAFGPNSYPEARWSILFNGKECTYPGRIESAHRNHEYNTDHQKASGSK